MRVITVARKPLSESSVAANVLEHGTGALNIDGTRVSTTPEDQAEMLKMSRGFVGRKMGRPELMNYGYEGSMPTKTLSVPHQAGRWPANLILQHKPGCCVEGGMGTADAWECEPGCPVADLETQTCDLLPQGAPKQKNTGDTAWFGGGNADSTFYGDCGGASRFFKRVGGRGNE